MKLNDITYVPVLNGSVLNCALRDDLFINGERATFYTEDGIFKYPVHLINPFHHAKIYSEIKKKKLLLASHISMADSVTKDETIIVKDKNGNIKNMFIGDFVDKFIDDKAFKSKEGHDIRTLEDYKVLTINNNFKQCFKNITKVIRHKVKKDIYRIITTSGKMIELTEDHSLITLDKDLNLIKTSIKDMKVREDHLLGIKNIDVFNNKEVNEYKGIKLDKSMLTFLGYWVGDGSKTPIEKGGYDVGISGCQDVEALKLFRKISKRFDRKVKFNGNHDAKISSKEFNKFLHSVGFTGYSSTKRVPSFIFNLSKKQIGWFLNGLFSADGTCKYKGKMVGWMTVSKGLYLDVTVLLKILGISFNIRYEPEGEYIIRGKTGIKKSEYILSIYGKDNLEMFDKCIGFFIKRKQERLDNIVKFMKGVKAKNYYENIPIKFLKEETIRKSHWCDERAISIERLKRYNRKEVSKLFDCDIGFYLIKTIEKIKYDDYVYDLSVEDVERFLCSNVLCHNSGGLQEITLKEVRMSPAEVFRWQQEHVNIGFSVDCMPFITPEGKNTAPGTFGGWIFDKKNFAKYAEKSKQNIEDTKPFRDKKKYPDFKFYGIIQGRKYSEYLEWYEILRDDAYLDGYCVKAPNTNPMSLAETCIFVMNNMTKPVHFLGIGNLSRSIVLYYANKYIKQPITFDSSSYDIGTQYRSYLLPFMMNRKLRFVSEKNLGEDSEVCNRNDIVYFDNANDLCDCVVCRTIGDKLGDMIKTNHPALGGLISVHNLILNIRWNAYVKGIRNHPEKLKEFVKYNFEPSLASKIFKAFEMIDLAAERGPMYALDKFKDDIQRNKEAGKQSGVFDF